MVIDPGFLLPYAQGNQQDIGRKTPDVLEESDIKFPVVIEPVYLRGKVIIERDGWIRNFEPVHGAQGHIPLPSHQKYPLVFLVGFFKENGHDIASGEARKEPSTFEESRQSKPDAIDGFQISMGKDGVQMRIGFCRHEHLRIQCDYLSPSWKFIQPLVAQTPASVGGNREDGNREYRDGRKRSRHIIHIVANRGEKGYTSVDMPSMQDKIVDLINKIVSMTEMRVQLLRAKQTKLISQARAAKREEDIAKIKERIQSL